MNSAHDESKRQSSVAQGFARWGFVIAGVLFLVAATIPALRGEGVDYTFLVLGIVFLVLGSINVRKGAARPDDREPK